MKKTTLTISSKNYSSWSLRGWLLARMSGIAFDEVLLPPDDSQARAELLLLSPSILVPCLTHDGVRVWDTLAIAEYLNELAPKAGIVPADRTARALPLDLRRDALRLQRAALGAADERQGPLPRLSHLVARASRHRAHRRHLARVPLHLRWSVSVRQAVDGRRDVRAGSDALSDLRREARPRLRRLCGTHHGVARHAGVGGGGEAG